MVDDWGTFAVEELVDRQVLERPMDGNHGSIHPKTADFVDEGIPFVTASDLRNGHVDLENCAFITEEQARNLRKGFARSGDVLLSHKATLGRTAIIGDLETDYVVLTPQLTYYRILDRSRLDRRFLRYYFDSHSFQQVLEAWAGHGSTRAYLSITGQLKLPIVMPPLPEQKAIAHILGSLDDKIELTRRMNRTLEQMAAAIFKAWFVDFEPVKAKAEGAKSFPSMPQEVFDTLPTEFTDSPLGPIPKSWSVVGFGDVAACFDSKRIPLSKRERAQRQGSYPYYGAASVMDHVEDFLFDGIYVLMGEDGSVITDDGHPVLQYVWGQFWVNNHAHVLQGKNGISTEHLLLSLRESILTPYVTGAVQPKLNQGNMNKIPFVLPALSVSEAFARTIDPLFAKYRTNVEESRTLAAIRDALLPKLLSGEIPVGEAERIAEEVA